MSFLLKGFGKPKGSSSSLSKRDGGRPLFLSQPFVSATLVNGNFKKLVILPKFVDLNEWLAAHSELYYQVMSHHQAKF
jgi:hypothetical protein